VFPESRSIANDMANVIEKTLSTCTMFCMQPKSNLLSYSKIRPDIVLRLSYILIVQFQKSVTCST